jgi:hypothetical protein
MELVSCRCVFVGALRTSVQGKRLASTHVCRVVVCATSHRQSCMWVVGVATRTMSSGAPPPSKSTG